MSITYILLSVSIVCNVWFVLLLLADRIADTKAARLLRGIADVWKSLHETSEERPTKSPSPVSDNEIIGKSKFRMQPPRPTAATPVPKDSTPEKGVEMSENDITFESENKDSEQETDSARIPDEKLDEAFKTLSPDELGYSDDEPEEENDRPRASGFSFDEMVRLST